MAEILRAQQVPRWETLEAVVVALYGDREEFRELWTAAREEEQPLGGAVSNGQARKTPLISPLDYFCYISQSKVEKLHATLTADTEAGDVTRGEQGPTPQEGMTFGRPHLLYGGTLNRPQLVRRLNRVVHALATQGAITELGEQAPPPAARFVHCSGIFQADRPVGADPAVAIVRLSCVTRPGLSLDCSLRYFSEMVDGRYMPSSDASDLFEHSGELTLETVFVLLRQSPGEILGSPLYLKLRTEPLEETR